ncbi:hypothetical protein ACTQ50_05375 [Blautia sp. Sow4_E7]|uniref:hypothetical protein n=1 Tax=Blautia sp. Sow4_E7 TaxID=3438749 RepID=UPI003F8E07F8
MKRKNERLVIDGNAIYELDLECARKKQESKGALNKELWKRQKGDIAGNNWKEEKNE